MRYSLSFLVAVCLLLTSSGQVWSQTAKQSQDKRAKSGQATLYETLGDIKAFSKRMDHADEDVDRVDAIVDLCALYLRVVGDSRFSRSEMLQGYRGRIASRLQKARTLIEKSKRRANKNARSKARRGQQASESVDARYVSETTEEKSFRTIESAVIDKQWLMIARTVGGTAPSMYYSSGMYGTSGHVYRGRAGGLIGDNGEQLLNLVQTIIHPDFWQINGGPGRAYYYQPLRILVVRATQRVHEDLQSLLERLRGQL